MAAPPTAIALIPARSTSRRIPDKNVRVLGEHPLIAYTIAAALESGVFAAVVVSTDSKQYAEVARYYGAEVPFLRPEKLAGDVSPDIEWVEHMLGALRDAGRTYDCFGILRPTSPFRRADTIRRAWQEFMGEPEVDSLRAVELCSEHPGKMWIVRDRRMTPLLSAPADAQPWHSTPYQALPQVYAQNASLEMAYSRVVFATHTIAGSAVMPFFTSGYEGFDLNRDYDWAVAEELLRTGAAALPLIGRPAISSLTNRKS